MWVELICGLVIFRLLQRFFSDDSADLAIDTSKSLRDAAESSALFAVADRLQSLYGGKAYVGLRIPDPDSTSRRNIDIVLVTNTEAVVISIVNHSGTVSVDWNDGSWICSPSLFSDGHHRRDQRIPDPLAEIKQQVSILESYLEQRGLTLFEGYLSYKVICPNPDFRIMESNLLPPEIITYDRWTQQKSDPKSMLSGWIKGALGGGKKEMQEFQEKLHLILGTAPMWDRLELKGNKLIFGEFLEFKGKQDDIQGLRNVRRSKVGRLIIQKTSMFSLARSTLQVVYSPRDYQGEWMISSEWKEVTVKSKTEIVFQPKSSNKIHKYKLSSVISMTLSA